MLRVRGKKKTVKTIAIASGKVGVGKTNVAINLAIAMRKLGKHVMIVDAAQEPSDSDASFRLAPQHNIQYLLNNDMTLRDVVVEGPHGIQILPAGSGGRELTALNEFEQMRLLEAFNAYSSEIDVLLIDTAAGISENLAFFCMAAQEIIIVASPETAAVTDAYALIKTLNTQHRENEFHVLVNAARSSEEAVEAFRRLALAAEKFPSISLDYLGYLPFDKDVTQAVRAQAAFIDLFPGKFISTCVTELAEKILSQPEKVKGTLQFFMGNLFSTAADGAR